MEAELHVALYLKTIQKFIIQSLKKTEEILDVANDVYYKRAKLLFELVCIVGYTKMTKVWI
jgi:hypothetical protein